MNRYTFSYVVNNIIHRKMRSLLTVLSILIGICAIFALVSFGWGLQSYVNDIAADAGVDKLFIQSKGVGAPGTDENFFLTKDDVDFTEKMRGVRNIAGMYTTAGEIKYKKQKKYYFVMGFNPEDFIMEAWSTEIINGRQLKDGELDKVVLGYNYQFPDKIFKNGLNVGDKIEINNDLFDVVGFYDEIGNPSDDANVFLTKEGFEALFPQKKDKFAFVIIKADQGVDAKSLGERIRERLRKHKGQEEGKENFYVQTFEDALQTFNTIISILNGVLLLIALVSVVVASVNIMNTMYTAVIERTKEIGIMKSIGATNNEILSLFVIESGLLGMIGGILGVMLGYALAKTGGSIAAAAGFGMLRPVFPWYLVLDCIFFAFIVGAVSGVVPAYQASKLKPVDALRYE